MFLPDLLKKSIQYGLIIISLISLYNTTVSVIETSRKGQVLTAEAKNLNTQKEELEDKFLVINSEEFVEKEARTRLNMKKEGEDVYFIPENEKVTGEKIDYSEYKDVNSENRKSIPDRWFELLF